MEEESWRRNRGGGIMEEESWRRNHGGKHQGLSGRHLGSIWEASGSSWGCPGSPGGPRPGRLILYFKNTFARDLVFYLDGRALGGTNY